MSAVFRQSTSLLKRINVTIYMVVFEGLQFQFDPNHLQEG